MRPGFHDQVERFFQACLRLVEGQVVEGKLDRRAGAVAEIVAAVGEMVGDSGLGGHVQRVV